ncbi:phosphoribosyl pyrophosphate synthase-associated protein 2 isoform X2 [Saimiri boliviensis]|uniref:phosphoribosyl pyrophosphate synthase-associated protein 2 isoform X2 n=1 Tax=Saimiri boliviensis TaxID=27679 RepID=UPI003D784958
MFCVTPPELETKMNITKGGLVLFSANSNSSCMELSKKIAERLGVEMGKVQVYQEPNRETRVQIQESVRGKDVFIIQTVSKDVNTTIMELLIMVYACKTSCAKSIIGVIPYFPYSKQCKMRKRGSIVSKLLASMMCKAGLTHLITMDLHQKEIQGFFNIPVDNLRASPFLLQYIQEEIPDYRNAVIVAKSPASAKRWSLAVVTWAREQWRNGSLHCNLRLLGFSSSSASASQIAEIMGLECWPHMIEIGPGEVAHACNPSTLRFQASPPRLAKFFVFLVEMGFHNVGQAGLELLTSGDLLTSQSAGITGLSHCAQP